MVGGGDWRAWAAEKRELLARGNADRALLIEENKRLRAALDTRGMEVEARLRAADEDRARLAADLAGLSAARNRAEAELRQVYRQWEEDGRRWAVERKRLNDQLDALLAATASAGSAMLLADAFHGGHGGYAPMAADVSADM
jgi:seryl-tRNA synthetase